MCAAALPSLRAVADAHTPDGNFYPPTSPAAAAVFELITNHSATIASINSASPPSADACFWAPPTPMGRGCSSVQPRLQLGAMPWQCLAGEAEDLRSCTPPSRATALFLNPPAQWRGKDNSSELPPNAVEALIMGSLVNTGSARVNLRGAWFVVPFSRGVQTKFDGEWLRLSNPNEDITRYCWFATAFGYQAENAPFVQPYAGDLCSSGRIRLSFTSLEWPAGTKRDRGLNISFPGDFWLEPGQALNAGRGGVEVMFSFKTGLNSSSSLRIDAGSLATGGALECPLDPAPPPSPPPRPDSCPHPRRACADPLGWAAPLAAALPPLSPPPSVTSSTAALQVGAQLLPGAQFYVSARVRISAGAGVSERQHLRNGSFISAAGASGDTVATTAAPNPGEQFTSRVSQGIRTQLILRWRSLAQPSYGGGGMRFDVVAHAEVPLNGSWATLQGVFEFPDDPAPQNGSLVASSLLPDAQLVAEAAAAGLTVELDAGSLRILPPWALNESEASLYAPCQLDPVLAPDAVFILPPQNDSFVADLSLCSSGYDQSVRVYDRQGALIAASDAPGGPRAFVLPGLRFDAGQRYTIVVDGVPGTPYGSDRGGCGIRLTRPDGHASPLGGGIFDSRPPPDVAARFVRPTPAALWANGSRPFSLGCNSFSYVGTNTFDLMDTARYPNLRYLVDRRLDDMASRGLTVGRTWGFSLGTGESLIQRQQALQLRPGVYDEGVFQGLDYALVQARLRGIKLVICLEDYWLSVDRYLSWSATAGSKTDFYTVPWPLPRELE